MISGLSLKLQQALYLSKDSIKSIVQSKIEPEQQLILQILNIYSNYQSVYYGQISDGYSKIKCELGQKIRQKIQSKQIQNNSIIMFTQQDCQLTLSQNNHLLVIYNCKIIKTKLQRVIGSPLYFNLYKEKNYINQSGCNKITEGPKLYTIKQILQNNNVQKLALKGKVIKLPKSLSRGMMMFQIQDQNYDHIQGTCFQEDIVQKIYKSIKLGQQYIFTNYMVVKNRKTGQSQLKFKNPECIIPLNPIDNNKMKSQSGVQNQNPQVKHQYHNKQEIQQQQLELFSNKSDLLQYLHFNPQDKQKQNNRFFHVMGKVTYLNQKPKFRKINIIDQNKQQIDLLFWEEIRQNIQIDKIYKFKYMRIKRKQRYLQLHSSKNTTIQQIQDNQWKLMILQGQKYHSIKYAKNSNIKKAQQMTQLYRLERTKKLPELAQSQITTLQQIIRMSESQSLQNYYPYAQCYIKIRTDALRFREDGDCLNFFNFFCGHCRLSVSVTLGDNDVIFCNKCKKNDIQAKWSLRVRVMDRNTQIPCSLQNQTTQRLLNIKPIQAFILYMKNKQQFAILLNKFNFEQRICKFQIKTHGVNKYFNVLEIYNKDTKKQLETVFQRLINNDYFTQLKNNQVFKNQ